VSASYRLFTAYFMRPLRVMSPPESMPDSFHGFLARTVRQNRRNLSTHALGYFTRQRLAWITRINVVPLSACQQPGDAPKEREQRTQQHDQRAGRERFPLRHQGRI